jgi:hypothetical protein
METVIDRTVSYISLGVIINEDWKEKQPEMYRTLEDWAPVRAIFNELHTRYLLYCLYRVFTYYPGSRHPIPE